MDMTPRLGLPLLAAGQAQKEIIHNEALWRLEQLVQPVVQSRAVAPPAGPQAGEAWIVQPDPTGEWAGMADHVAVFMGAGWSFVAPFAGMMVWIVDEAVFSVWEGGWQSRWPVAGLEIGGRPVLAGVAATVQPASGGSVVDEEARAVLSQLIDVLRDHGLLANA